MCLAVRTRRNSRRAPKPAGRRHCRAQDRARPPAGADVRDPSAAYPATFTQVYTYVTNAPAGTNDHSYQIFAASEDGTWTLNGTDTVCMNGGNLSVSGDSSGYQAQGVSETAVFSGHSTDGNPQYFISWGGDVPSGGGSSSVSSDDNTFTAAHTYDGYGEFPVEIDAVYLDQSYQWVQTWRGAVDMQEVEETLSLSGQATNDTYTLTPTVTNPGLLNMAGAEWQIAWGDGTNSDYFADDSGTIGLPTHVYAASPDDGQDYTIEALIFQPGDANATTTFSTPLNKPTVGINASHGVAYESGQVPDEFIVARSGGDDPYDSTPLTVSYSLGGTAFSGEYILTDASTGDVLTGSLTIPAGATYSTIVVTPIEDHTPRFTDTLIATLTSASQYSLGTSTATTDIVNDDLGVTLGDGSANIILDGSTAGNQDLVPLTLTFPSETDPGATLTLSESQDTEADVWATSNPGPTDTPLIGDVNGTYVPSITWTYGTNTLPSTTLWVAGTGGSASMNDIDFTLGASDAHATSAPAHPTTKSSATQPTQDVTLRILSLNNPNDPESPDELDVTGKTRNWLIGQMVDLEAELVGPPSLTKYATFQWNTPPGNAARLYVPSAPSLVVPITDDDGGALGGLGREVHTGITQSALDFFWISTTASPGSYDTDQVTVSIPLQSDEVGFLFSSGVTFHVYTPTYTTKLDHVGIVGFALHPATSRPTRVGLIPTGTQVGGIGLTATVATPGGPGGTLGFEPGEFTFIQLEKVNRLRTTNHAGVLASDIHSQEPIGTYVLDNSFPYPSDWGVDPFDAPDQKGWMTEVDSEEILHGMNDSPADGLGYGASSWYKFDQIDDEFNTYLLYRPPEVEGGPPSQWVPLAMEDWAFKVTATLNRTTWTWSLSGVPALPKTVGFTAQTTEPSWPSVWLNDDGPNGTWPKFTSAP